MRHLSLIVVAHSFVLWTVFASSVRSGGTTETTSFASGQKHNIIERCALVGGSRQYDHDLPSLESDASSSHGSVQTPEVERGQAPFGPRILHTSKGQSTTEGSDLRLEERVAPPPLDIHPLFVSGPSSNRVDLVFFSDGYLTDEKPKFLSDALRLAEDISGNRTFNTVKPLLNFWAAFTPSKESGVGVGGKPKDTPFGLYRDGTELRAVYYAHPDVARAACDSMKQQCDYPILLGNDPLYGGLGGQFTVITSSQANGPIILRHELGHSIIEVGEEYDGGFAYYGVNAYHNLSEPVPWAHWLSPVSGSEKSQEGWREAKARVLTAGEPPNPGFGPRVERSVMPLQTYAWTLLNTTKAWGTTFVSSGNFSRFLIRVSLSGLPDKSDFRVELDGVDLEWTPPKGIGVDRWFSDFYGNWSLEGGKHELEFTLLNGKREGTAQMCSAEVLEFGDEKEFVGEPGFYGVFPTYSDSNQTTYRPTNEDCLMRQVTTPNLCKVCREGLWYSLLRRVRLIDGIEEGCQDTNTTLNLKLLPLAQLREVAIDVEESWFITWWKNGEVLPQFTNQTVLSVESGNARGNYSVDVRFRTEEIRKELEGQMTDSMVHIVSEDCTT